MTHGSLFSGIGGFDLGFERANIETVWQSETEPYCRKILKLRFPDTKLHGDIRRIGGKNLEKVDIISGGFPCQDISTAGKRAGIRGNRSGLWFEMLRICHEMGPRYLVVENVAALLVRGIGEVLGTLSEIGYDAEWEVVSAADVGASHLRRRIWIIAYPNGDHIGHERGGKPNEGGLQEIPGDGLGDLRGEISDPYEIGLKDASERHSEVSEPGRSHPKKKDGIGGWWAAEPDVGRVAHGIPARVDRLKSLGNAIVPQIAFLIGKKIVEIDRKMGDPEHEHREPGEAVKDHVPDQIEIFN